jgi:hypothetical protein
VAESCTVLVPGGKSGNFWIHHCYVSCIRTDAADLVEFVCSCFLKVHEPAIFDRSLLCSSDEVLVSLLRCVDIPEEGER